MSSRELEMERGGRMSLNLDNKAVFAAHREAEAARIVAWLRGHHWTCRYMPTMEMVAEYIERGKLYLPPAK